MECCMVSKQDVLFHFAPCVYFLCIFRSIAWRQFYLSCCLSDHHVDQRDIEGGMVLLSKCHYQMLFKNGDCLLQCNCSTTNTCPFCFI